MEHKKIIKTWLSSIITIIDDMSEDDIQKVSSGNYRLSLTVIKSDIKKAKKSALPHVGSSDYPEIIEKLNLAKTRDEGVKVLEDYFKNKMELEKFAKHIDVAVMKSDKVLKIKESIVDATVGARLRSGAIQGKEI